jgi:Mg2+ and Co2+ transporter CorA
VTARWLDLVDPTRDELLATLPVPVDPEVVEALTELPGEGREPRPLFESHGTYVFGVLLAARPIPHEDRVEYLEIDVVATPTVLVTVRKTPGGGSAPFDPSALQPALEEAAPAGVLIHRLADEVADSFVDSVDATYAEIEELEDGLDAWPPSRVRMRISALRHELLLSRRTIGSTRGAIRRVVDGRIDVGDHALFPTDIERLFAETYDTLVRTTEELDIARDLLAGVRDHHQSKITEGQGDIAKKLTVVASLVLVPSLIVGYFGQNFESAFDDAYWSVGVSSGLIFLTTLIQLAIYRWRRWI